MRSSETIPPQSLTRRQFLNRSIGVGIAASVAQGLACSPSIVAKGRDSGQPNIVIFLSDTLRADHLGAYNDNSKASPTIDRFAEESMVFERAYAHAPHTKPSVASLFTGVSPRVHRAVLSAHGKMHLDAKTLRVQKLRASFTTLAESLKQTGYSTGYFLSNPHVQEEFGFAQGFDEYFYQGAVTPTRVTDRALSWSYGALAPFFMFIHEIDPHGPYAPTARDYTDLHGRSAYSSLDKLPPGDRKLLEELAAYHAWNLGRPAPRPSLADLSEAGNIHLQELYDAEIRGVDYLFQRTINALKERGQWKNSVVVFLADHGEEFNDHGGYFHAHTLYDELLHVPLIVGGGWIEEARRVSHSVNIFDVYPTLAGLAGGVVPDYVQGQSLLDSDGNLVVDSDRAVISELDYGNPDLRGWDTAMSLGKYKVMSVEFQKEIKIFDRDDDPGEKRNLWQGKGRRNRALIDLVKKFDLHKQKIAHLAESLGGPEWTEGSDRTREELEALGYLE